MASVVLSRLVPTCAQRHWQCWVLRVFGAKMGMDSGGVHQRETFGLLHSTLRSRNETVPALCSPRSRGPQHQGGSL